MIDAELRAFVPIDRMQPQYAAYWGLTGSGSMPASGMSQLLVEVQPGNVVYGLMDAVLKAVDVRSCGHLVERDFGLMEMHARSPDAIAQAGDVVLAELGCRITDRLAPRLASEQVLTNVTDYHSQLLNRVRRGDWILPGACVYVAEVTPAAYVNLVGNEIEKALEVDLARMAGAGVFGRLIVGGTETVVQAAAEVARRVVDSVAAQSREESTARPREESTV